MTRNKIRFIPNWATLVPAPRPVTPDNPFGKTLAACFTVGLSGNLGFAHDPEIVFEAARLLKDEADIYFLVSGWGINGISTFQAGFPAFTTVAIPSNGIIPVVTPTLAAQQMFYVPLNYKNPYVESWNLAVQQALPYDMSLQIAYVGNHGVGIPGNIDINNPLA